jgi:glucose-1-phosphate thymidylyltransferase
MKVLILAGGFATRLWPITENRAKPLLRLAGKTILAHILAKIPTEYEVILLTNQKFKADFEDEIAKISRENIKIFLEDAITDGEKLGALSAISVAIDFYKINENLVVLAGDNLLPELIIENLIPQKDEAILVSREVATLYEARKFGVLELASNNSKQLKNQEKIIIKAFEEKPEKPKSKFVSTGFLALGKNLLTILQDFAQKSPDALGGIFPKLLSLNKKVYALPVGGEWFDVGSFETYLVAHKKIQKNSREIEANTLVKNTEISGKVYIGEDCEIKDCLLIDTIIYPNTILKDCRINNCIIDENCNFTGADLSNKLIRKNTKI